MNFASCVDASAARIPAIGLGTWQLQGSHGRAAVEAALQAGYRHIDTATRYENEAVVGEALRRSGIPRDQLFVTTKVWYTDIADGMLQRSAQASLQRLGLDHVDLLLIHWPSKSVSLAESLGALSDAKRKGFARHIGVANFPAKMLGEAIALCDEPIVANQCEYHPYLDQTAVLDACRSLGIAFVSYSPLGSGTLLDEPSIGRMARRYGRSPAQIVLRWHMQQPGVAAIPRSSNPDRIAANLDVFDFELSAEDMAELFGLARSDGRVIDPAWAPHWDAPRASPQVART